jgi:beta-lactamase class A
MMGGTAAALIGLGAGAALPPAAAAGTGFAGLDRRWAAIEAESGGRLGVALVDTGTGARAGHRAGERFPMCSTFKLLAAGAVLARVDAGHESLDRRIRFERADLVVYSPETKDHVGGDGMTLGELCEAALTLSDNTAANMLLGAIGGPKGVTAFARSLDDGATRLDRTEPDLNEARPGDRRDVTTPAAMLADLEKLVLGSVLSPAGRQRLVGWLMANKTGDRRLRAGLPADWRVGDKTGSGAHGTSNDVGVIWPPGRPPILLATYLTTSAATPEHRDATLAAVGRSVAEAIG